MTETKVLNEITILRAIACLSIVMLHAIKLMISARYDESELLNQGLLSIAGFLSFGTPAFIFISALLLAYPGKLVTSNYLNKRVKYLLIPFLSMAVFYACITNLGNVENVIKDSFLNMIGGYHGWFVLVIFQFYLLYNVFAKALQKYSMKKVLFLSLITNVSYLAFFNITDPISQNRFIVYFWETGYFFLFFGWIFYFSLAFYLGRNYNLFTSKLKEYQRWVYSALPLSMALILFNTFSFGYDYGSKRWDMIFFSIILILILLINLRNVKTVPTVLIVISNYSFGIYLFHMFALSFVYMVLNFIGVDLGYINIMLMFMGSVLISIIAVNILNRIPFGKYVLGVEKKVEKRDFPSEVHMNKTY